MKTITFNSLKGGMERPLICNDFKAAFERCGVVAHPVAPAPAFNISKTTDDPLATYLSDIYSATGNLAGLSAISVPCGKNSKGLPVGIQFVATTKHEKLLLSAAEVLEVFVVG